MIEERLSPPIEGLETRIAILATFMEAVSKAHTMADVNIAAGIAKGELLDLLQALQDLI